MKMRTTCPNNNKYYITTSSGGYNKAIVGKPTKAGANVLSNCVGYANGRFAEIIGKDYIEYQLVCNAENFIEKAKSYGLTISNKPSLGAIMVWEGKGSKAGHVAIVERVDNETSVYTSESAYGGSAFYNTTRNNSNGRWGMGTDYPFRGFIVNPSNPQPEPTPSGDPVISYIQSTINNHYGLNIKVDGKFGPESKCGLIKALQIELNTQCQAGLKVDGIFGPLTKSKCPTLRYGAEGWITWNVQCMLYCKGYYLEYLDGIYKDATINQITNFQINNNLTKDGVCGKQTYGELYN